MPYIIMGIILGLALGKTMGMGLGHKVVPDPALLGLIRTRTVVQDGISVGTALVIGAVLFDALKGSKRK